MANIIRKIKLYINYMLTTRNTSIFIVTTVVCKPACKRTFRYISLVSITMQSVQHYWPATLTKCCRTISTDIPKMIFISTIFRCAFIFTRLTRKVDDLLVAMTKIAFVTLF